MRNNSLKALSCLVFLLSVQSSVLAMDIKKNIQDTERQIADFEKQIGSFDKKIRKLKKDIEANYFFQASCSKSEWLQKSNLLVWYVVERDSILEELEDAEEWLKQLKQYR